ncbi:MAG TPA: trypsin-like peptidase domain-containing protein [Gemmataceae bacterium]|jgi:S1-C subfamily serine protease|nr:trypsin-like peptidase domain-containing protein [Gemmataceae bacterium]
MSYYDSGYVDEPRPRRRPQGSPVSALLVLLLVAVGAGAVIWYFVWPRANNGLNPNVKLREVAQRGPLLDEEAELIKLYEETLPSVVHINNLSTRVSGFNVQEVPRGSGSGFVWDQDGHIVTNYHVVEGATALEVVFSDQSTYKANNVWVYPNKDIAVVSINAPKSKLKPIPLGTSHDLKVGQKAIVIGNPFGLDGTLTTGVISALNREITSQADRPIQGVIQTSAPINPGNSGGPLLDSAGRLIGITTAILSPSGAFVGIGFAIPSDDVNQIVTQLIASGKVTRPRLGVVMATDQQARQLNIKEGVLLVSVVPDGPAAKAALRGTIVNKRQLGDIIVSLDNTSVKSPAHLQSLLEKYKVGDTVTVGIIRDGEHQDVPVTLEAAL